MGITRTGDEMQHASLPALLRLCSPSLPIGAFAYSGGLEAAVDAQWVCNEADAAAWIDTVLREQLAFCDLPLLVRFLDARRRDDHASFMHWQSWLWATRETAELVQQDAHQGEALRRLLIDLEVPQTAAWLDRDCPGVAAFAFAAHAWNIGNEDTLVGYAWSICEAQVHAAVRLIPLGQTSGQRILARTTATIPTVVEHATRVPDEDVGTSLPALAIGSCWHPWQYTRLFRS